MTTQNVSKGIIKRLRTSESDTVDTFDPGQPGTQSVAHRWVERTLQQTARTFHLAKPAFKQFAKFVIVLARNPNNMAEGVPGLTPAEVKDLYKKFLRIEEQAEV